MKRGKFDKEEVKRKALIFLVSTAILMVILVGGVHVYNRIFKSMLENHVKDHLSEIAEPSVNSLNMQMEEQVRKVKIIVDFFETNKAELDSKTGLDFLDAIIKYNTIESCYIIALDGTIVSNDETINAMPSLRRLDDGDRKVHIKEPIVSAENKNIKVIPFTAPIYKGEKLMGTVVYLYSSDKLGNIFDFEFLGSLGELVLINKQGDQLLGHSSYILNDGNAIDFVNENCKSTSNNDDDCIDNSLNKRNVKIKTTSFPGYLVLGSYKANVNDWYLLAIVPENIAATTFANVFNLQHNFSLCIVTLTAIYILFLLYYTIGNKNKYDKLTGLPWLPKFICDAKKILKKSKKDYVFVKLDVRNFKLINRICGYEVGDKVLVAIANNIANITMKRNTIGAREGKDSFIFMLPYVDKEAHLEIREEFVNGFHRDMGLDFHYKVEFPSGQLVVKNGDPNNINVDSIMEKINFAHGIAKYEVGDNVIADYQEDLEGKLILTKEIESEMSNALNRGEFKLYLQPKVDSKNEEICGAESLVRWVKDGKIYKYPNEFIPIFEKNGFVTKIDMEMFERTVEFLKEIIDAGGKGIPISVNFSRIHLWNDYLPDQLSEITKKYNVPNELIEIELTESIVFETLDVVSNFIETLQEAGFKVAVDDFGSAYSSLSLIKNLKFNTLKLDKSFFELNDTNERGKKVVMNVVNMAKELHTTTVAEGIEVEAQVELVRDMGCDMIQGYYYYKPTPAREIAEILLNKENKLK